MATVADIIAAGSELITVSTPIYEPLNAPGAIDLSRFGENYNTSTNSHLFRFLVTLVGEAGAGGLRKELTVTKLQQRLESTYFSDLDRFYGSSLALPRINTETYNYDPYNSVLTQDQWDEVRAKDASYRSRCLTWMRAIIEGPTPRGISLAAEAATGVGCDVIENYKWVENQSADLQAAIVNHGTTLSPNEFIIIPRQIITSDSDLRKIHRLVDKLRPVNTICSIQQNGNDSRAQIAVTNVVASSERFAVKRLVTGRPDVVWPAVDITQGNWVVANIENEAPTAAFMDRQETVTYTTIQRAAATTTHVGRFNSQQSQLFSHLVPDFDNTLVFAANQSYAQTIAPVNLSTPWVRSDNLRDNVIVNNYYPLDYFGQPNVDIFAIQPSEQFWASNEDLAPSNEQLTLNFGTPRPVNFIDFEICHKPIDINIEYFDTVNQVWASTSDNTDQLPRSSGVTYSPSLDNPWGYYTAHFNRVVTDQLRLTFTRRTDPFPFLSTEPFMWSIEVRNLRTMHLIADTTDFITDSGQDVLGNSYRTQLVSYPASNVNIPGKIWKSKPIPSAQGIEALYFDLRYNAVPGNMSNLDVTRMNDLDTRGMSDMEVYLNKAVVVDEVMVDPLTTGADVNLYYSIDDTPEWDEKLWVPINRKYILHRGFMALPQPTLVKYFKMEFTNLAAEPYQPIEYPDMPATQFRRFPTWVQDYFNFVRPTDTNDPIGIFQTNNVKINPLKFGFEKIIDNLDAGIYDNRPNPFIDKTPEVQDFITQNIQDRLTAQTGQSAVESLISFNSPLKWQNDLISQLDLTRALSRVAATVDTVVDDNGWNSEMAPPVSDPPVISSTQNLIVAQAEKTRPSMRFPRRARHGYQIAEATFDKKVAYSVMINAVSFWRRDYTAPFDEKIIIETLDDTAHVFSNDFVATDWRYIVGSSEVPQAPLPTPAPNVLQAGYAQNVQVTPQAQASMAKDSRITGLVQTALAQDVRETGLVQANIAKDVRATGQASGSLAQDSRVTSQLTASYSTLTPTVASDTFTRTVTMGSGWGSAPTGGAWTTYLNNISDSTKFGVNVTVGQMMLDTVSAGRDAVLQSVSVADVDISARFQLISTTPSGASVFYKMNGRMASVSNLYTAKTLHTTSGTLTYGIDKVVSGTSTGLASGTYAGTVTPGNWYRMRFQIFGTTLRMRLWDDLLVEPNTWDTTITDSTFTAAGFVGLKSLVSSGNTNLPTVLWDDFTALQIYSGQFVGVNA